MGCVLKTWHLLETELLLGPGSLFGKKAEKKTATNSEQLFKRLTTEDLAEGVRERHHLPLLLFSFLVSSLTFRLVQIL